MTLIETGYNSILNDIYMSYRKRKPDLNFFNHRRKVKKVKIVLKLIDDIVYDKTQTEHEFVNRMYTLFERFPDEIDEETKVSHFDHEINRPGNPGNKPIRMPEGFYKSADKLKEEFPEKSLSWIENKLLVKYFDGDLTKKMTVYRRLRQYWQK